MAGLAAAGLAILFLIPKSEPTLEATGSGPRFNPFGLGAGAWVLATAYFGYRIGTEGFLTFGPDALVARGVELARASAIVGSRSWHWCSSRCCRRNSNQPTESHTSSRRPLRR